MKARHVKMRGGERPDLKPENGSQHTFGTFLETASRPLQLRPMWRSRPISWRLSWAKTRRTGGMLRPVHKFCVVGKLSGAFMVWVELSCRVIVFPAISACGILLLVVADMAHELQSKQSVLKARRHCVVADATEPKFRDQYAVKLYTFFLSQLLGYTYYCFLNGYQWAVIRTM